MSKAPQKPRYIFILPAAIFLILGLIFIERILYSSGATVPSALLNQPAPNMQLTSDLLDENKTPIPSFDTNEFKSPITLVNIFASWCVPCRKEHPFLMQLANNPDITIIGMNYKDSQENAQTFLDELGNPYDQIGSDEAGRNGIEWGVYGVPETFIINQDGIIIDKIIGPITPLSVQQKILSRLQN